MRTPLSRSLRRLVAPSLLLAGSAIAAGQDVDVDGDLADLAARSQAQAPDAVFDVAPGLASGWDFTHVFTYYSSKTDGLFVGIDLLDTEERPGVAGDADGDGDPSASSRADVPEDQFGVGPDEAYLVAIDTDVDGSFTGPLDLLVLYRNNELRLLRGDGAPAPLDLHAEIALGVRGAGADPGIPNENRETEDVEIGIHGYAFVDLEPCRFRLSVFAGSLVDTLNEDRLDEVEQFTVPELLTFRNEAALSDGLFQECVATPTGATVTVRVTLSNLSEETLRPVFMVHFIPDGLRYVEGSAQNADEGRRESAPGGVLVHHIRPGGDNSFGPGESEVVTFEVAVESFPRDPLVIRGMAEGRLPSGSCLTSCLDAVCVDDPSSSGGDGGRRRPGRLEKIR